MTDKTPKKKRPRDTNQLGKRIVDIATGESEDTTEKLSDAALRGQAGGHKGGPARANMLSPEQRKHVATVAARARWKRKDD